MSKDYVTSGSSDTFIDDGGHGNPISFARSQNKGTANVGVRIDPNRTLMVFTLATGKDIRVQSSSKRA
jgi:hypothetical protein